MSDDQITRELSEQVMGWKVERIAAAGYLVMAAPHELHSGWNPLVSDAHAAELARAARDRCGIISQVMYYTNTDGCEAFGPVTYHRRRTVRLGKGEAPRAICLAIALVLGVEVGK